MAKSTAVKCGECGKQLGRKADLKRHMMLHSRNKEDLMHSCPFLKCTYKTLQRSNLDTHINMHTGRRPHKCPTRGCGFRTSDPGSLTKHRKVEHGYLPRGRAKSKDTADESEAAERSPSSSLSSIPNSSSSLISPVESSLDAYQTPLPELPQMLGPYSPLIPSMDCCMNNDGAGGGSVTFPEYSVVDDQAYPVLNTEGSLSSFLLAPELLMSEEASILDHAQVSATERWNLRDINLAAQPFPELTSREVSNATFDNLLPQSNYSQTPVYAPPFVPTSTTVYDECFPSLPAPPNAVDNSFVTSAGLDDYDYIFSNTSVPSGSQLVGDYHPATSIPSGCDLSVNNASYEHYGYGTHAASFDGQPFEDYSFAVPDMGHHQVVDQMHPYTTPTWSGGYPMPGSTYSSDQPLLLYS